MRAIAQGMGAVAMQEQSAEVPAATGRVLIADDQAHIVEALEMLLRGSGFSTETVSHPARVLRALEASAFDAVVMDLNYTRGIASGEEGLELVSQIRARDKLLPVLVMTAWGSCGGLGSSGGRNGSAKKNGRRRGRSSRGCCPKGFRKLPGTRSRG
jgi:PleD family two-component response regulator